MRGAGDSLIRTKLTDACTRYDAVAYCSCVLHNTKRCVRRSRQSFPGMCETGMLTRRRILDKMSLRALKVVMI